MFIFSNLATSLDGKIATASREPFQLGTGSDLQEMLRLRKKSDAILYGASTLRVIRTTCRTDSFTARKTKKQPMNVVISSRLEGVSPDWDFFHDPDVRRVLFVAEDCPETRMRRFQKSSTIIRLKSGRTQEPVGRQIISALKKLGVRNLLVEGGGAIMWDFVSEDLINEYHITHVPRLIGGTEAPTLVDGPGLPPDRVVNVRLKSCRRVGDELYLVYTRTGKRGRKLPPRSR